MCTAEDGVYGARVSWVVPGSHTVTVVASGSTPLGPFQIEDRVAFYDRRGLDADDDGLPDAWERRYKPRCPCGLNPRSDSDGDGLDNWTEWRFGSNPLREDTDGDGATDAEEFAAGTNPNDPRSGPGQG